MSDKQRTVSGRDLDRLLNDPDDDGRPPAVGRPGRGPQLPRVTQLMDPNSAPRRCCLHCRHGRERLDKMETDLATLRAGFERILAQMTPEGLLLKTDPPAEAGLLSVPAGNPEDTGSPVPKDEKTLELIEEILTLAGGLTYRMTYDHVANCEQMCARPRKDAKIRIFQARLERCFFAQGYDLAWFLIRLIGVHQGEQLEILQRALWSDPAVRLVVDYTRFYSSLKSFLIRLDHQGVRDKSGRINLPALRHRLPNWRQYQKTWFDALWIRQIKLVRRNP